jgi:hypothetical protein
MRQPFFSAQHPQEGHRGVNEVQISRIRRSEHINDVIEFRIHLCARLAQNVIGEPTKSDVAGETHHDGHE